MREVVINAFNREQARRFNDYCGEFMLEQGYIDSLNWWEKVKI